MARGVHGKGGRATGSRGGSLSVIAEDLLDESGGHASADAESTERRYLTEEEQALLVRAQAGDERALRHLYATYQGQVRGHLYRVLGSDHEIDDMVQTVFARAFGALDTFKGNSAFSTWLYRITANSTHNLLRQRFRRNRVKVAFQRFRNCADAETQRPISVEARDEAARILDCLRPELREVFVLYHYEGLTLHEISSVLERPVSTVGDQLTRARKKLRDLVAS